MSDVKILSQSANSISLSLNSATVAAGGHFRSCGACVLNKCVGIFPSDTRGEARATSSARLTIEFTRDYAPGFYDLYVTSSSVGGQPVIKLIDSNGKELDIASQDGVVIGGSASGIYYLNAELPLQSANSGGCCDDQKQASARIDVRLRKAALLNAMGTLEPYIKGGDETKSYTNVGAILLGPKLHCTGTIIGTHSVLTAAHCLQGYEDQIDKMTFILGSNLVQPTLGPFEVNDIDYPKGANPAGYEYNPKTYEDDIGIVYLKNAVKIPPSQLHRSQPLWQDILSNGTNLIFVGFGYDVIEGQPVGSGIKREGAWMIGGVENRRVTFSVPGKNTCKGDSGGPAFVINNGALVQVAITSTGDNDCTRGVETRVDAFSQWLEPRVR